MIHNFFLTVYNNFYFKIICYISIVFCFFQIKGHRLLFKIASPVFKALFFGPWEKKTEIEIEDIDSATFLAMMR